MPFLTLLAQEHPKEDGHEGQNGPEIDPMHAGAPANNAAALWSFGIVLVLIFVLWKLAWGPIAKGLASREDRINESLKRAEELEKATRELAETNRRAMEKAQLDAQAIVAEARLGAQKAASEIAAKAEVEIEATRDRFQREMRLEADKVRDEIRREAVELTLAATARMLGRVLTPADHHRLADEALIDAERVARN